jgi:hypothetical protein
VNDGPQAAVVVDLTDAVSCKLRSDKPSLISAPRGIPKLGLLRDEGRRNLVALPQFVTNAAKFRDDLRTRDQRELVA